jgi:hypothetical protein
VLESLEARLRELEVDWPATPDLAAAIEPRLAAPTPAPTRRATRWRLAAVAAVVVAGVAASPARSALLDLLGLRGARVERREPPPHPTVTPGRFGEGLRLGEPATLESARAQARFALTVPASLGAPDAVWIDGTPARVSFVYRRRPGIRPSPHTAAAVLLTQFEARVTPVLEKAVGTGARIARYGVPHARVYAITGRPHGFAWIAPDGSIAFEDRRLAGATLLVERDDGILLRAEGELSPSRARALARELAAG